MAPGLRAGRREDRRQGAASRRSARSSRAARPATRRPSAPSRRSEGLAEGEDCNVLFHDAVRPLLSSSASSTTASRPWSATRPSTSRSRRADTIIVAARTAGTASSSPRSPTAPGCAAARPRRRSSCPRSATPTSRGRRPQLPGHRRLLASCCGTCRTCRSTSCAGDEYNMKVTQPGRRLHRRQALPARLAPRRPRRPTDAAYRELLTGRTLVVFGGSYGIGEDIAELAEALRRQGLRLGRSTTGTHVENPRGRSTTRCPRRTRRPGASTTSSTPRACCASASSAETDNATIEESAERQLPGPGQIARAAHTLPRARPGPAAALHLQQLHPRPGRVQPLLLDQGRRWSTSPRPWPTSGPATASGSTASTPSAPPPRCAPRPSVQKPAGTLLVLRGGRAHLARRAALRR